MTDKKITIITSVYNADKLIETFLKNICILGGFSLCELLLYDISNSHKDNKYVKYVIELYQNSYPNITYIEILEDPGLYEIWNMGIRRADTEYITNANLDDIRKKDHLMKHLYYLEKYNVDLVSCSYYTTKQLPDTWIDKYNAKITDLSCNMYDINTTENIVYYNHTNILYQTSTTSYIKNNLPHCAPIWNKRLHNNNQYFDEYKYGFTADTSLWYNSSKINNLQYLHIKEPMVLCYINETTHSENASIISKLLLSEIENSNQYKYFITKNKNKYKNNRKLICMATHFYLNFKILLSQ